MVDDQGTLRERTRRAVQREITDAARSLFVARGYTETTVADIAGVVGMSERSIFRYFPTKEDILLTKFGFTADELLDSLRGRPVDEPVWDSFRRVFDALVAEADSPSQLDLVASIHRIVLETPSLFAAYLEKLYHLQTAAVDALTERAQLAGHPYALDDPAPRALAAAAFGCLVAAQQTWLAAGATGSYSDAIDRAMASVRG